MPRWTKNKFYAWCLTSCVYTEAKQSRPVYTIPSLCFFPWKNVIFRVYAFAYASSRWTERIVCFSGSANVVDKQKKTLKTSCFSCLDTSDIIYKRSSDPCQYEQEFISILIVKIQFTR